MHTGTGSANGQMHTGTGSALVSIKQVLSLMQLLRLQPHVSAQMGHLYYNKHTALCLLNYSSIALTLERCSSEVTQSSQLIALAKTYAVHVNN